MEAAANVSPSPDLTFDSLLAETRRLRQLAEGLDGGAVVDYSRAVVDLVLFSARRIETLAERIAQAADCTDGHKVLKNGPLDAFVAGVDVDGTLDGLRPIGACKRCHSSIVHVGGGA